MMLNKFSVSLCLILACDFMDERKFVLYVCVWGGGGNHLLSCEVVKHRGRWRARGQEGNGERHWGEAMTEATTRTNFLGV